MPPREHPVFPALPDDESRQAICNQVDALFDKQVAFLAELVRHPSLRGQEEPVQDLVEAALVRRGYAVDRFAVDAASIGVHPAFSWAPAAFTQGTNIVAIVKGAGGGRSLALNAHVDVVPPGVPERWSSEPFEPVVRDGWLHGRGAADMKAGLAANIFALDAIRAAGIVLRGDVQVQSVIEEEVTGNGAATVLARGYTADAFLCPEPTGERLVRANSGIAKFALTVAGVPSHPQEPAKGRSAIDLAVRLMAHLRVLEAQWIDERLSRPHFAGIANPVSLTFGTIDGGEWQASIPSACRIEGRIGFFPGDDLRQRTDAFEAWVAGVVDMDPAFAGAPAPEVHWNGSVHAGYELAEGSDAEILLGAAHTGARADEHTGARALADTGARALADTGARAPADTGARAPADTGARAPGHKLQPFTMPCYLDGAVFAIHGGMTCLVYGPVGERIHGIDERVDLASLRRVTKTIALFVAGWCGTMHAAGKAAD